MFSTYLVKRLVIVFTVLLGGCSSFHCDELSDGEMLIQSEHENKTTTH